MGSLCNGRLGSACPTDGTADGLGACSRTEMQSATETQKEQAKKPALKVHDLYRNPKRVKKSSVQDGLSENERKHCQWDTHIRIFYIFNDIFHAEYDIRLKPYDIFAEQI